MRVVIACMDERAVRLAGAFKKVNIQIELSDDLGDVSELLKLYDFDMLIVDARLPKILPMIIDLRRQHKMIPLVVIGSEMTIEQSIGLFAEGVDDVVNWSTEAPVLAARLQAIVRRYRGADLSASIIGSLRFDMIRRSVKHDGASISLTAMEYEVLEAMVLRKGTILTKEALLNRLYGGREAPSTRTIDVFICQLRKKLAAYGVHDIIETVRGLGYLLNDRHASLDTAALSTLSAAGPDNASRAA